MKKTQHCQCSETITQGKKQHRPPIRHTIPACKISSRKIRRDPCMLSVLTTRSPRCASSLIRAYHSSLCELWRPSMTTRRALSASAAASRRLCYFSAKKYMSVCAISLKHRYCICLWLTLCSRNVGQIFSRMELKYGYTITLACRTSSPKIRTEACFRASC